MKQAAVLVLLLSVSTASIAQSVHQSPPQIPDRDRATNATLRELTSGHGCPIDMRAERMGASQLLWEIGSARQEEIVQRLRLIVAGPIQGRQSMAKSGSARPGTGRSGPPQIVAATVIVRGYSGKARSQEIASSDAPNASRTLNVSFLANAYGEDAASVRVAGLAAVQSIDVKSLSYADGSTWTVAHNGACRIIPDPLMLVSDR